MLPGTVIDLAEVVATKVRELGYKDAKVHRIANITDDGIAIIRGQTIEETVYFDGLKDLIYPIRIVVSREQYVEALEVSSDIAWHVTKEDLSSANGSYKFTSADVYEQPHEIDFVDGCHIFETTINAMITTY